MKKENAYLIGRVVKPHGLKGELGVSFEVEEPELYVSSEVLFLEDNNAGLVPYFIESKQFNGTKGILKFEAVNTQSDAAALRDMSIYIPLGDLPQLDEGQIYYHEFIGFQVQGVTEGLLGEVTDVYDFKSHVVLGMSYQNKEVLIPLHEDIIEGIDEEKKILMMNIPEGLIDLYLNGDMA